MTAIQFLSGWGLRSAILILSGALLLLVLRVKDPSIRLAAWTVMLFGSLSIPALTVALPNLPLSMARADFRPVGTSGLPDETRLSLAGTNPDDRVAQHAAAARPFDWSRAALSLYVPVALGLLLRLCVGVVVSLRLLRGSGPTNRTADGIEIRESARMPGPATLGIIRSAVVLPNDWRRWPSAKLDAVVAHECSHIRRYDPAVQFLSAVHRALLWFSPLSWFLHNRIVRAAEEASDDAAVSVMQDRALYAEVLLGFMQRGTRNANWLGVPMARYSRPDKRLDRILDGTTLSHGITRWSVAAILATASPLAYVVAAVQPQVTPRELPAPAASAQAVPVQASTEKQPATAPPSRQKSTPDYMWALGTVTAYTVTVKPRVDGELMSVSFKEGDLVHAGQILASIDPRALQFQLAQAEGQLAEDQGQSHSDSQLGKIKTDQAIVDNAKLQLSYAQVTAPITGVTGLRLVDPGNVVHTSDATGIVVITQLQPIAVLFGIEEDSLPRVRARLKEGGSVTVEAWNRADTVRLATGRLMAVDNQIDNTSGTVKLKAVFDNKDDALFPNQFVIVHMLLNNR